MERKYKLSGFPKVGNEIEVPDLASLVRLGWYQYADFDYVYKHGGDDYRNLLDSIPLRGDKNYVSITSRLQYLSPSAMSIKFLGRWHIDGTGNPLKVSENDDVHLLINDCTARTEFNTVETETDSLDINIPAYAFNHYLDDNKDRLGLTAKAIEPNRFVSFDSTHAHRAVGATKDEMRFMFRVIESNTFRPEMNPVYFNPTSTYIFKDAKNGREIHYDKLEDSNFYLNLHQEKGKLVIHL